MALAAAMICLASSCGTPLPGSSSKVNLISPSGATTRMPPLVRPSPTMLPSTPLSLNRSPISLSSRRAFNGLISALPSEPKREDGLVAKRLIKLALWVQVERPTKVVVLKIDEAQLLLLLDRRGQLLLLDDGDNGHTRNGIGLEGSTQIACLLAAQWSPGAPHGKDDCSTVLPQRGGRNGRPGDATSYERFELRRTQLKGLRHGRRAREERERRPHGGTEATEV